MTKEQLGIINSLLTFAAENIPGGLKPDEAHAVQVFGRWAAGGEFYAMDLGSSSIRLQNDGQVLASFKIDENNQRRLEAHILGQKGVSLKLGPGETVELDKTEGSTIFMPIRIITDPENMVWRVKRYSAASDSWETVGVIEAQMASDFEE